MCHRHFSMSHWWKISMFKWYNIKVSYPCLDSSILTEHQIFFEDALYLLICTLLHWLCPPATEHRSSFSLYCVMNSGLSFLPYLFLSMHRTYCFHCFTFIVSPWLELRLEGCTRQLAAWFLLFTHSLQATWRPRRSLAVHKPFIYNHYLNRRTE